MALARIEALRCLPDEAPATPPVRVRVTAAEDRERYDRFLASHPAGSLLQSWEWGTLKERHHWEAVRLLARDGVGRVCGAASVLCRTLPVGGAILYLPRGPVLNFRDSRVLDAMTTALRRLGERQHAVLCKIDPYVSPPDPLVVRALTARGFVAGHRRGHFEGIQPRFNVIVPLTGSADTVLARCHPKTRYNIRLSARRGVQVRRGHREDLVSFHRLLMVTCERNGFAERSLSYFAELWDALAAKGQMELYVASDGERDLAAGILFLFGNKAVYAYGASGNEHRERMAPYALQWAMIQRAVELGCTSYDMTGVPRRLQESEPGYGLYRFKRGFWPEVSKFVGEMDLPLHPTRYRLWNLVEPAYWGGQVWVRHTIRSLRANHEGARTHPTE